MYSNGNRDRARTLTLIRNVGPKKNANESVFRKIRGQFKASVSAEGLDDSAFYIDQLRRKYKWFKHALCKLLLDGSHFSTCKVTKPEATSAGDVKRVYNELELTNHSGRN